MASQLVVLVFEGAETAEGMLGNLRELEAKGALKLDDVVTASRDAGGRVMFAQPAGAAPGPGSATSGGSEVEIKQTDSRRGRRALAGGGVGLIIGTLLGGPIGGVLVGSVIGALHDRGIDDKFIKEVSDRLVPDSSAIFMLVASADGPKVLEELKGHKGRVIHTTLTPEQEKTLRDAMEEDK